MAKSIPIVFPDWRESRAYIADATMLCAGYGVNHIIQEGDLYTKHKSVAASYAHAVHPFCRVCIPRPEKCLSLYPDVRARRTELEEKLWRPNLTPGS